jgi:hypothetical protein
MLLILTEPSRGSRAQIQEIEEIDLTGGDHTLTLDGASVREMSSGPFIAVGDDNLGSLRILADSGDTINFTDTWTLQSTAEAFFKYTDGVSDVFITATDIIITIDGVAP